MKNILLIFIIIATCSCNNYLDKSIFEPLLIGEIKKEMGKDSMFAQIYEGIQSINKEALTSDIEKAKFSDLTYRRILNIVYYKLDSNQIIEIQQKWKDKYGRIRERTNIDSISNYWAKYQKDNALEQYVSIDFAGFDKQKSSVLGKNFNLYARFKIIPLKGSLNELNAHVKFKQEDGLKDGLSLFWSENKISIHDEILNSKMKEVAFKALIIDDSKSGESYTTDQLIKNLNIEEIIIDNIYKSNKCLTVTIPKPIKSYWDNKDPSLNKAYIDDVIHELVNNSYIQEYKYINSNIEKILREKDSLAIKYLDLAWQ